MIRGFSYLLKLFSFKHEEEKDLRVRLLSAGTKTIILLSSLLMIGAYLGGRTPTIVYLLNILFIISNLCAFILLQRGYFTLSGIWILGLGLVFVTAVVASLGGIRVPVTTMYVLLVIVGGLVFDMPGIFLTSLFSSLAVAGLIVAGNLGYLPTPDLTNTITQWVTYTVIFAITSSLTYFSNHATLEALKGYKKEIAERQSVELELRKLLRAVEQSPVSIIITDLKGNIEYVNPRFSQVTGYNYSDAVGQNPRMLKTDLTLPGTHAQLWKTISTGKEWRGEFVNRKKDGSIYFESASISPILDREGGATNFLSVQEDITETRRIQRNIQRQRDLAQELANATTTHSALENCLTIILDATGLDCGGIYLVDPVSQDLTMIVSIGLSDRFIQEVQTVPAGSPRWQIVMTGQTIYTVYDQIAVQKSPVLMNEGLRAFGFIPVLHQGQVIACFNLSSHTLETISQITRDLIEEMILQIGNAIVRIQAQEDLQKSHDQLRLSEDRFRSLFEQTHDAVFIFDLEGHYLASNQRGLEMFGYTLEEILTLSVDSMSDEPEESRQVVRRLLADEVVPAYEKQYKRKNGELFSVEVTAELVRDKNGDPAHIQSVERDISERKKTEKALRDSEAKYRIVSDNTYDWEFWSDASGKYIYISPSCEMISGYSAAELLEDAELHSRLVHPEDKSILNLHREFTDMRIKDEVDFRIIHKDGGIRWINHVCSPVYDDKGEYLGIRGSNRDITLRKQADDELMQANNLLNIQLQMLNELKDQLSEQALRDTLTGLYNRRYLNDLLPRELILAQRSDDNVSVVIADIDHFKDINDTYGHKVGDEFLKSISSLMSAQTRGSDIACRYGGEEFVLVLPGATSSDAWKRIDALRQQCQTLVIRNGDQDLNVTMSFGIATFPTHGRTEDELLTRADNALYASKHAGRNRVTLWQDEPQQTR